MFPNFSLTVISSAFMHRKTNSTQLFSLTGGEGYKSSVRHYLESSCEIARAAVQPGSVKDLSLFVSSLCPILTKVPLIHPVMILRTVDEGSGDNQSSVCRVSSTAPILLHNR